MIAFLLWCMLFVLCWPVALLALIAYPFVWLLLLPFRIVGIAVHSALALVAGLIMLPFRLLSAPFRIAGI
jgi:flagellar biosynthesis protein FliP